MLASTSTSHPPQTRSPLLRTQRIPCVRVFASGGFGKGTPAKKKAQPKESNLEAELRSIAEDTASAKRSSGRSSVSKQRPGEAPAGFPVDWVDLKTSVSDFTIGKPTKPLILANGKAIMLYKHDNKVYCSDANSTAYQYPMTDAQVWTERGLAQVESPLDGTIYDLATGAVITWCPKDGNVVRSLLGTLKQSAPSTPLTVYPTHVTQEGAIWIKLLA